MSPLTGARHFHEELAQLKSLLLEMSTLAEELVRLSVEALRDRDVHKAASVILAASSLGIPVSTTHNISSAIMGVGTAKRSNAIKWTVVEKMIWAWILTIPMAGGIAYLLFWTLRTLGWA